MSWQGYESPHPLSPVVASITFQVDGDGVRTVDARGADGVPLSPEAMHLVKEVARSFEIPGEPRSTFAAPERSALLTEQYLHAAGEPVQAVMNIHEDWSCDWAFSPDGGVTGIAVAPTLFTMTRAIALSIAFILN